MHDPLTLSTIIDNSFVIFDKQNILMEKDGRMFINNKDGNETIISIKGKHELFMQFLIKRIKKLLEKYN